MCQLLQEPREGTGNPGGFQKRWGRGPLSWPHEGVASELIHAGRVRACQREMVREPSRQGNGVSKGREARKYGRKGSLCDWGRGIRLERETTPGRAFETSFSRH